MSTQATQVPCFWAFALEALVCALVPVERTLQLHWVKLASFLFFFLKTNQPLLQNLCWAIHCCSVATLRLHVVTSYSTCDQPDLTGLRLIRWAISGKQMGWGSRSVALPSFPGHYRHHRTQHGGKHWRRTSINDQRGLPALEHSYIWYFSVPVRPSSPLSPPSTVHLVTSPAWHRKLSCSAVQQVISPACPV